MIGKLSYNEVLAISKELQVQADIIEKLAESHDIPVLSDFVATVEGYSKFLETTVNMNKDADEALKELKEHLQ
jgi:hypothetical protein